MSVIALTPPNVGIRANLSNAGVSRVVIPDAGGFSTVTLLAANTPVVASCGCVGVVQDLSEQALGSRPIARDGAAPFVTPDTQRDQVLDAGQDEGVAIRDVRRGVQVARHAFRASGNTRNVQRPARPAFGSPTKVGGNSNFIGSSTREVSGRCRGNIHSAQLPNLIIRFNASTSEIRRASSISSAKAAAA
nr:hypothetical protein [Bradyrhizobium sp. Ec3.3]